MELTEAFRRVVLRHKRIIVLFILLGAAVPIGLSYLASPTYTASTRFVLDAPAPTSEAESTALADAAEAIVTSPQYVTKALTDAGVSADPLVFARDEIQVQALGTSGVLELSVTTENADTASKIANALADKLLEVRRQTSDALQGRLTDLGEQLKALDRAIASTTITAVERADLIVQRQAVQQQIEEVRTQIAARPQAGIIDEATPPLLADPSARVTQTALGILLGLILGVGLAAFSELLRPTAAGPAAVARALGTRVLGSAARVGDRFAPIDPTDPMVVRLRLAAAAESVTAIEVLAVPSGLSATSLAYRLEEALAASGPRGRSRRSLTVRAFGLEVTPGLEGPSAAVVVAEPSVRQKELDAAHDLLSLAELPVLGVIVADRLRRRGRQRHEAALKAKPERATGDQLVVLPTEVETARPDGGESERPSAPTPVRPVRPARPTRPVRRATSSGSNRVTSTSVPPAGTRLGSAHPSVLSASAPRPEVDKGNVVSAAEPEPAEEIEATGMTRAEPEPETEASERGKAQEPHKIEAEEPEAEKVGEAERATTKKPASVRAARTEQPEMSTSKPAQTAVSASRVRPPAEVVTIPDAPTEQAEPVEQAKPAEPVEQAEPAEQAEQAEQAERHSAEAAGSELAFQPAEKQARGRRPAPKKRTTQMTATRTPGSTSEDTDGKPGTSAGGRASAR